MNYKEIRKILEKNDNQEVVKAIISFELGITDERFLNKITNFYFKETDIPNLLDHEICEYANLI